MISAVVQKLRIIQTFSRLTLLLLIGFDRCRRRCCAELRDVTKSKDDTDAYQRKLEFFHALGWHLLFCDRLPALNLSELQVHEQREKEYESQ